MDGTVLEVRNLKAAYGQTRVLEGVDLTVAAGEFVVVIGPNGHGKTTLLRTISGLVPTTAGEITFDGERIDGERPERIAMRGLVHIPQGDLPFVDMTVEENFSHVQTFDARVLLLESGRVVREGLVGDLLADEIVMATYLGT